MLLCLYLLHFSTIFSEQFVSLSLSIEVQRIFNLNRRLKIVLDDDLNIEDGIKTLIRLIAAN